MTSQAFDIFTDDARLPRSERTAFFNDACGGDVRRRSEVERLVRAGPGVGADVVDPHENQMISTLAGSSDGRSGTLSDRFKFRQKFGEGVALGLPFNDDAPVLTWSPWTPNVRVAEWTIRVRPRAAPGSGLMRVATVASSGARP